MSRNEGLVFIERLHTLLFLHSLGQGYRDEVSKTSLNNLKLDITKCTDWDSQISLIPQRCAVERSPAAVSSGRVAQGGCVSRPHCNPEVHWDSWDTYSNPLPEQITGFPAPVTQAGTQAPLSASSGKASCCPKVKHL